MPNNLQFINVLTPAASTGTIEITLTSYDGQLQAPASSLILYYQNPPPVEPAAPTVVFVIECTGITSGMSEIAIATQMQTVITPTLLQYNANFIQPIFGSDPPIASWRNQRTDHVVSMFSECQFLMGITSNNTGADLEVDTIPYLLTPSKLKAIAPMINLNLFTNLGVAYTNAQLILLIQIASNEWVATTNNNIVICQYVHNEVGNISYAMQLKKIPIVYMDVPRIRRPNTLLNLIADNVVTSQLLNTFIVDRETGWINDRFAQDLIFTYGPFDARNEIAVSYAAGYKTIPTDVQNAVCMIAKYLGFPAGLKKLDAGTLSYEPLNRWQLYKDLFFNLRRYFLSAKY